MPHTEEEIGMLTVGDSRLVGIKYKAIGQITGKPSPKFKIYLAGGVEIEVKARSEHKARCMAIDIMELMG